MNIAILIGVSSYKSAAHLPACVADVEQMHKLLLATKKYEEIYPITTKTEASSLKDSLRDFFKKYQNIKDIEEVFFYFSGHGIYQNDALLCCSDFDLNRPSTTSISNLEIDDLFRSVSPKVAVKVIDACQSGSHYIKDAGGGFEKALTTSRLESFICMASSRQDQSSYASHEASNFTKKWIDSALEKQSGIVLYRDIQAALADAFVANPDQTPFFTSQGTGLEMFSSVTEEMRGFNSARNSITANPPLAKDTDIFSAIESEVKKLDSMYVSLEDAKQAISVSRQELANEPLKDEVVASFYQKKVFTEGHLAMLPRIKDVAEFADEQKWSKNYFVKITTETYQVKVPKNPLGSVSLLSLSRLASGQEYDDSELKIVTRNRPTGLLSTQGLPFEIAQITFQADKHPSLKAFILYIGIVHSLTELMVLSATVRLSQKGWEERSPDLSSIKWKYQSYLWAKVTESPRIIWEESLINAEETLKAYLEEFLPKNEEPA